MSEMLKDGQRSDPAPESRGAVVDGQASPLVVLEELRERVLRAVDEIERLRGENRALARRIEELVAQQPSPVEANGTHVTVGVDSDPAELKTRVEAFIGALDRALEVYDDHATNPATESA